MTATAADQTPRRRGRPGYDLESVLRVAVEVFNERGYDGASMEDLSRRLGIAKSAIYHHVAGKEELLRMALDRALDGWSEAAERARALDAPAIVRLEMLVRGTVAVLESQLPYVTLLLRVRGNTDVERAALARRRSFDSLVADLVAEAERDGDVRADVDPKSTARPRKGRTVIEWAIASHCSRATGYWRQQAPRRPSSLRPSPATLCSRRSSAMSSPPARPWPGIARARR